MAEASFRAGAAERDITPPMGVEMCGYGPYEKRVCTEVLDPLYARALWLECGGQAVAMVTLDACMISGPMHEAVARELSETCGLEETRLLIVASHTHSGPATHFTVAWGKTDPEYLARLPGLLAGAVQDARAAACPARLGSTRVRVDGVGVNREQFFAPVDTAAQLLRVDRLDGTPIAVVYNFGAHGVVRYPFTSRISADWPGLASATIRSCLPGVVPLFLQGPCANINGHQMTFNRHDPETCQKVADMRVGATALRFTEQVIPALTSLETDEPAPEIQALWKVVDLPCVPPDRAELERIVRENQPVADRMTPEELRPLHERLTDETAAEAEWRQARYLVDSAKLQLDLLAASEPPYVCKAPLQVLRIGGAVHVGWPGEIFVELGTELRQRSPFPLTFVSSFANDTVGYIPTEAVYESKGKPNDFGRYPREMTPLIYGRLPFRHDVGTVLLAETMAMLTDLHERGA